MEFLCFSYLGLFLLLDRWLPPLHRRSAQALPLLLLVLFATADFRKGAAPPPHKTLAEYIVQIPGLKKKTLYNDGMGALYAAKEPSRVRTWQYQRARDRGARSCTNFLNKLPIDLAIVDQNTFNWLATVERKYGTELTPKILHEMFASSGFQSIKTFADSTVVYAKVETNEGTKKLEHKHPSSSRDIVARP